jgi:hypothetical protein
MSLRVRLFLAVALSMPLVFTGRPIGAGTAQTPETKSALVTVVADSNGPFRGLTAQDFIVTEDGRKRPVVSAELAAEPLSIALLIDTTQPPMGKPLETRDIRSSLSAFVKAIQTHTRDAKISIAEFAGASVMRVDFTSKTAELDAVIGKLYPNHQSQGVLLEALVDASKRLGEQPPPRRAIVTVDFNSTEASAERTMKTAVEGVHKAGATLWPVSVRGTVLSSPIREEVLNKVTEANGGVRFMPINASGLEASLRSVAHSLASQYNVTFVRPGGDTPRTTKFETTRGFKVRPSPWMR